MAQWIKLDIDFTDHKGKRAIVTGTIQDEAGQHTYSLIHFKTKLTGHQTAEDIWQEMSDGLNAAYLADVAERPEEAQVEMEIAGWEAGALAACNDGLGP